MDKRAPSKRRNRPLKNPTAEELAVLRERAERTFSRFPVLPRREDGRMSPESRLRFELTLETILEKNRALGACVVLRRPSGAHETFCFGTARLLGRVPVTEETCFRVASVSKLVMTFGALALVERGVLRLDDDLSACLGYPVRNPRFPDAPVTLRMLLTHTAAIRDEGNYGTRGMQKGCTLRELLENAENWLNAKPGEAFHYSNLGAGAAGVVIAVVQHGGFQHGHGRMQGRSLGTRGTHLDDALTGAGDVGIFLAQGTVGEDLHLVFAARQFLQILAELVHADGFRFAFGLHTGDLDDDGLGSHGRRSQRTHDKGAGQKQCNDTFHHPPLLIWD